VRYKGKCGVGGFYANPRRARIGSKFQSLSARGVGLLTENEIVRSWRKLFGGGDYDEGTFSTAENLLESLRPESPLRHRLSTELIEIRKLNPQS